MAKFCGKCGAELDQETGRCPNCEVFKKSDEEANLSIELLSLQSSQEIEQEPRQSNNDVCVKTFVNHKKKPHRKWLIAVMIILLGVGTVGGLYYAGFLHSSLIHQNGNNRSDLPETELNGIEYYESSPEHVVQEDGCEFINNEILVMLKENDYKDELETYLISIGGKIVGGLPEIADYHILLDKNHSLAELEELKAVLEKKEWVQNVSVNYVIDVEPHYEPNDTEWAEEWSSTPDGINWGMEAIDAPGAWEYKERLTNTVNIGIFDNQFKETHPDLEFEERPWKNEKQQDKNSHGTHVAGTIAASFDNGKGVTGVAINHSLYGVSSNGLGSTVENWKYGLGYLIQCKKCKVINISMGLNRQKILEIMMDNKKAVRFLNSVNTELSALLDGYIERGYQFVVCKSAGNSGILKYFEKDADDKVNEKYILYEDYKKEKEKELRGKQTNVKSKYERYTDEVVQKRLRSISVDAECGLLKGITDKDVASRIIVVGASGIKENGDYGIPNFSQCGSRVDILAPGIDIYSTSFSDYCSMDGTSMASPHVAGVAGLIFSANPNLTGEQVKKIICDTATGSYGTENHPFEKLNPSAGTFHYGLVNAKAAVEAALKTAPKAEQATSNSKVPAREIALVLDASGSMEGTPIDETKNAAVEFIDSTLNAKNSVGIVTYNSTANIDAKFSRSKNNLKEIIETLGAGGGTNIGDALTKADEMLQKSKAKEKIVVLMSDGLPTDGMDKNELIAYADQMKDKGIKIFTLGFFQEAGSEAGKAKQLMEALASEGCYEHIEEAEDLVFFFENIPAEINGEDYIFIRIACPVDVRVTHNGEVLDSNEDHLCTQAEFGSLRIKEGDATNLTDDDSDHREKILRLKEGATYNIQIVGTGHGSMDYIIGFMNDDFKYDDFRTFDSISITPQTVIDTTANNTDETILNIDRDGDGQYDQRLKAEKNGIGVETIIIPWVKIGLVGIAICVVIGIVLRRNKKKRGGE